MAREKAERIAPAKLRYSVCPKASYSPLQPWTWSSFDSENWLALKSTHNQVYPINIAISEAGFSKAAQNLAKFLVGINRYHGFDRWMTNFT